MTIVPTAGRAKGRASDDERGNPAQAPGNPKKRSRDESDFQLRIVVHPTVLERLRTEDEKHLIEMEKRYFGKRPSAPIPAYAEQFKIQNVTTNEELASVGS
jgi:hypothetical protein